MAWEVPPLIRSKNLTCMDGRVTIVNGKVGIDELLFGSSGLRAKLGGPNSETNVARHSSKFLKLTNFPTLM